MCITREDNRRLLAVGELLEDGTSQVCIIDLHRERGYRRFKELKPRVEGRNTTLAFSSDSKLVACVVCEVGVVWDWMKELVIGQEPLKAEVTRITVNPKDNHIISTSGPNHWKIWRVEELIFKEQQLYSKLSQAQNFIDHDWIDDDTIVVVTDMNEAFIARGLEIIQHIEYSFGRDTDSIVLAAGVTCVVAHSKGFLIGSDEGHLAIWELLDANKQDEERPQECFGFTRTWECGKRESIVSLALSGNEEYLGLALKSNDIGYCSFGSLYTSETNPEFSIFCKGFHSGRIEELDVAVQRPLIVTCSNKDATLRVWNYHSYTCELAKKLYTVHKDEIDPSLDSISRPLISTALHPSGYYLAVSFVDKVRLFHLLHDELRFFREINVGNAHTVRFSRGGHLLAVCAGATLSVYEAYTLRSVAALEDHKADIKDMVWANNDRKVITVGADGALCEYHTNTWKREELRDYVNPNVEFCSVTVGEHDRIFALGIEGKRSVVFEKADHELKKHPTQRLTALYFMQSHSKKPAYLGPTAEGSILQFAGGFTSPSETLQVHRGAVTCVRASPDGQYLFTAGEDGTIFIFKVDEDTETPHLERSVLESKEKEITSRIVDDTLADVVLVERAFLDSSKEKLEHERRELAKLKLSISQKHQVQHLVNKAKADELRNGYLESIKVQQTRLDELSAQKVRQEKDYLHQLHRQEENHNAEVDLLETNYERKLNTEEENFRQLEHDLIEMAQYFKNELKKMGQKHNDERNTLENEFGKYYTKYSTEYRRTQDYCHNMQDTYDTKLNQQEDEHEIEVTDIRQKHNEQANVLDQQHADLKKRKRTLMGRYEEFTHSKQQQLTEITADKTLIKDRRHQILELHAQTHGLEHAIKEKEENVINKEGIIHQYKDRKRELEKTKNLLRDKKDEILDEIQPKDEEIEMLENRLKNVQADLATEHNDNDRLQRELNNMDDLITILKHNTKVQQSATLDIEKTIRNIINEIHHSVSTLDIRAWPDELKKLYQNYVKQDGTKNRKETDSVKELEHQLRYMEKSIAGIRDSKKKVNNRFTVHVRKRTHENSTLIEELNKLRLENKKDEIKVKQLERLIELKQIEFKQMGQVIRERKVQRRTDGVPTPFVSYMSKPTPLDQRLTLIKDKQRILDIQNELEDKTEQNVYLKMEINQLREALAKTGALP